MNKTFLTVSLAFSLVALTGCAKKPAESNTPAPAMAGVQTVSADAGSKKSCSMKKTEGEMASKSCAKPAEGEMASKSCAKPAEGELAHAAGADCCKEHMAAVDVK